MHNRQRIDMTVMRAQLIRQLVGAAEANRRAFDIHQQCRAGTRRQGRPVAQAAIGDDQQALAFARVQTLTPRLPVGGLVQRIEQGRAAACAQLGQPQLQGLGSLLPLPHPLRLAAGGMQHGQARTLAARLLEHLSEQALGLAQRAVAAGRGRGIDDHQPQFRGSCAARTLQQILAIARTALEQSRRPVNPATRASANGTTATTA